MDDAPLKTLLRSRGFKLSFVANELGVDKATLTRWTQTKIPAERVADIERVTGVSRHELRPDLWEAPSAGAA